jgi:hypothetical protein
MQALPIFFGTIQPLQIRYPKQLDQHREKGASTGDRAQFHRKDRRISAIAAQRHQIPGGTNLLAREFYSGTRMISP